MPLKNEFYGNLNENLSVEIDAIENGDKSCFVCN